MSLEMPIPLLLTKLFLLETKAVHRSDSAALGPVLCWLQKLEWEGKHCDSCCPRTSDLLCVSTCKVQGCVFVQSQWQTQRKARLIQSSTSFARGATQDQKGGTAWSLGWSCLQTRQDHSSAGPGAEKGNDVEQEKVMAVIFLKLACGPPTVWTRVCSGHTTSHFVPQNFEA